MNTSQPDLARRQRGAALIVGLVLLLVLTLFAVSSMNTANLELIMAGNTQQAQNAFEAAESCIESEMRVGGTPARADAARQARCAYLGEDGEEVAGSDTVTAWQRNTLAPGYSIKFQAFHYVVNSDSESAARGGRSIHDQGFYLVGPAL